MVRIKVKTVSNDRDQSVQLVFIKVSVTWQYTQLSQSSVAFLTFELANGQ